MDFRQSDDHPSDEWVNLPVGWDGHDAKPPTMASIAMAARFVSLLPVFVYERVRPSVVGGIGVTLRRAGRKAYVEFTNDGKAAVLFSGGSSEPTAREIQPDHVSLAALAREIAAYLAAEAA